MDENKLERLQKIDELLESTEKRMDSNKDDIKINAEDFKVNIDEEMAKYDLEHEVDKPNTDFEDVSSAITFEDKPQQADTSDESDDDTDNKSVTKPIPVCIIDETSTTVVLEESEDIDADELFTAEEKVKPNVVKASKPKKDKKPKNEEKVKFNVLQWILIAVIGLVTVWFIIFTIDHTLSAQGLKPVFSVQSEKYDYGVSYKGLGYKIQFQYDANSNLTQKCVPFWKDGPNDITEKSNNSSGENTDNTTAPQASFNS